MEKRGTISVWVLCISAVAYVSAQRTVDDVRLVGSPYGTYLGRVEVQNNGTWGTICSNGWNYNSARVACRSQGYLAVVCAGTLPSPVSDEDEESVPIRSWISSIRCRGNEGSLSRCRLTWQGVQNCQRVGAAVCATRKVVGKTEDLSLIDVSPYTAQIRWTLPDIPAGVVVLRFVVERSGRTNNLYFYTRNVNITTYSGLLKVLTPNTTYQVVVRTDIKYSLCNGWLYGNTSDVFEFVTSTAPTSMYPVRLVAPWPNVDFLGRVEVSNNGTWGTICHNSFGLDDANVVCRMLGFNNARCSIYSARFGPGTGPIWINNLNCGVDDFILEDCTHRGWGVSNCNHNRDVGVICQPKDDDEYLSPVSALKMVNVNANSISLSWNAFTFPPGVSYTRYVIQYNRTTPYARPVSRYVAPPNIQITLRSLTLNAIYSINVRARYRFTGCAQYFLAQTSAPIVVTTVEKAPTGPPTSVHVVPLNNSAIELQWNLPLLNLRNGRIRGFKIFFRAISSSTEEMVDVRNPRATEFIIGGLMQATYYSFSVLAYTIAEGPRSVYLTAPTYELNFTELIIYFGPFGNGEDRVVLSQTSRNLQVHCGSGVESATLNWLYSNGSLVSSTNLQLRTVLLQNGTAMLQIANDRTIDYCDAGTYICKAVWTRNNTVIVHMRNFSLLVEDSPPTPSIPYPLSVKSTQITLGWYELECDGGHNITELAIRYRNAEDSFITSSYEYVYNIDASKREYTVLNLEPETSYAFSVQAISAEFSMSDFSEERMISTLVAAPSAPTDVSVRLIKSPVVEVTWKEPIDHYGIITTYIVYSNAPNVSLSTGPNTFHQTSLENSVNVSGHVGAVNISVVGSHSNVYFQVSAVIEVNGVDIEGEKSEITSESTIFVPVADLPVPQNVQVMATTNTSVTVSWSYPSLRFHVPFNYFEVSYNAMVNWRSPNQYLIQFVESGSKMTSSDSTSVVIKGLTPNTAYRFGVSVVTVSYGKGRQILTIGRTRAPVGGKLAYFQLKMLVANCYAMKLSSTVLSRIQQSLLDTFNSTLCKQAQCELTSNSLQSLSITCANSILGSLHALLRGRAIGGSSISADNMVSLLQTWVLSKSAVITVDGVDIYVASDCPVAIDHPSEFPYCLSTMATAVSTVAPQTFSTTPESSGSPKTQSVPDKTQSITTRMSTMISDKRTTEVIKFTSTGTGIVKEAFRGPSSGSNEVAMAVMGVILCIVIVILIVIVIVLMVVVVRLHRSYGTPLSVSWTRKSNTYDETGLVPKNDISFGDEFETKVIDDK